MTKIKIQTIAQGADTSSEPDLEKLAGAYTRFEETLKENGREIVAQNIENKLLQEGIIGPSNGQATYFFMDCLIENNFVPTFFSGTFHQIRMAGPKTQVVSISDMVITPRMSYKHSSEKSGEYELPENFNLSQFKSISDLQRFLTTFGKNPRKDNLFEQIKKLEGSKGDTSELMDIIEKPLIREGHYSITAKLKIKCNVDRMQIRKILRYCPFVFPETWDGIDRLDEALESAAFGDLKKLTIKQRKAYLDITENRKKSGSYIKYVIQYGVRYRDKLLEKSRE